MSASSCFQHPAVEATALCAGCSQPLCAACTVFEAGRDRCPSCVARYWRNRKLQKGVFATLGVAALALGVAYWKGMLPGQAPREPGFDYGHKALLVAAMREQLEQAPCDRSKAVEYLQTIYSADDLRGSIAYAADFDVRCGKFPQLRSITYSAHMRLKELDLAVRDATELIESSPGNAGYWVWRGMAREASSASALALADFQQAFRLKSDEFQTTNHLASAYERQGRICDAYLVLGAGAWQADVRHAVHRLPRPRGRG